MTRPNVDICVGGQQGNTVVLKPNISITEQMQDEDTRYIVKWDFEIPERTYQFGVTTSGAITIDGVSYSFCIMEAVVDQVVELIDTTLSFAVNGELLTVRTLNMNAGDTAMLCSLSVGDHNNGVECTNKTLQVPNGCEIIFDGGSITGGVISLENTRILPTYNDLMNDDLIIVGYPKEGTMKWDNSSEKPFWYSNNGWVSFDNTDYRIQKFVGKKIGIVGDSISTYAGYLPSDVGGYDGSTYTNYYTSSNLGSVQNTWWYKVAVSLGLNPETDVNTCSWSGSRVTSNTTHISGSTTDAYMGCSTRRITDLSIKGYDPDIIICFISCNDWGNGVSLGDWEVSDAVPSDGTITTAREGYALMLSKIRAEYPDARVFCCTNLDDRRRDEDPGWPSETDGVTTYEWNKNIIEIANAFGCDVINTHNCGLNYYNILQYAVDTGLHPNAAGHTLIANKVIAELMAKY